MSPSSSVEVRTVPVTQIPSQGWRLMYDTGRARCRRGGVGEVDPSEERHGGSTCTSKTQDCSGRPSVRPLPVPVLVGVLGVRSGAKRDGFRRAFVGSRRMDFGPEWQGDGRKSRGRVSDGWGRWCVGSPRVLRGRRGGALRWKGSDGRASEPVGPTETGPTSLRDLLRETDVLFKVQRFGP